MYRATALLLALCQILYPWDVGHAQTGAQPTPKSTQAQTKRQNRLIPPDALLLGQSKNEANAGTVTIMTQRVLGGPLMTAALDLSTLLDEGDRFEKLRVLPVIARGKMQNLWDMLYLGGIDLAFLQTDTLEFLKDDPQINSLKNRVRFINVMFPEEICIVARAEIKTLKDLAGKKVSINAKGTAAAVSAPLIFKRLGIDAIQVNEEGGIAMERMRTGDLAAHVFLLAAPARAISQLNGTGLHILPIPFVQEFWDLYLPSKFTNNDYPNLVPAGTEVETLAVGNILAVFNWPEGSDRYKKVARFTDAFFTKFLELHKPGYHAKWKEVNIAAQVPGWTRFKPAQEWLDKNSLSQKGPDEAELRQRFNAYLKQQGTAGIRGAASETQLFQQFLEWRKSQR